MPRFEPFAAIRYATDDLASLVAPPYDVLSNADVDVLQARSPHNVVWIDVPRGGEDRYQLAAQTMRAWLDESILAIDPEPSFTIYRLRFTDPTGARRDIAGVLGALEVVDPEAGGVLPHERTTAQASTDRLDLTRATAANLSPVWGLSLARGLTELLEDSGEALGSVTNEGVEHVVERVTDPQRIAVIRECLAADDVLIADGHHRYGISRTYRDEVREATGRTDTPAELTLAFVNELIEEQLSVAAIHRLYADIELADLVDALGRSFDLVPIERPSSETLAAMQKEGFLILIGPEAAWRMRAKTGTLRRRTPARWGLVGDCTRRYPIDGDLSARARRDAARSGQRAGLRSGADPAGQCRRDRTDRPRRPADATEVNLLHPQAQDRVRDSLADGVIPAAVPSLVFRRA